MTDKLQTTGIDLQKPIEAAVALGKDGVEVLERLQVILKDERDHRAKLDFYAARSALHRALKPIYKNRNAVVNEGFKYRYADLAQIEKALHEAGAYDLGFSWFFDSEYVDGRGMAVCILSHEAGHVERSHFPIETDKRANRAISAGQAERASTSYADRATLQRAFGISHLTEDDTDGRAEMTVQRPTITEDQALELEARCVEVAEASGKEPHFIVNQMCKWAGASSLDQFPSDRFTMAMDKLGARLQG